MAFQSCNAVFGNLSCAIGVRQRAIEACRRFIHERLEADGTLGSYILSTIFSMLALSALGRPEDESQIRSMKQGLRSFIVDHNGELHMQPCTSTVWDTALNVSGLAPARSSGYRPFPGAGRRVATRSRDHQLPRSLATLAPNARWRLGVSGRQSLLSGCR